MSVTITELVTTATVTENITSVVVSLAGSQGVAGVGVPVGGTAGQALTKVDGTNYNTTWTTVSGGGLHASTHAAAGSDPVTIAESQVTNLVTDLAAKAASVHTHAESDVTSLVTDLAAKAPTASPTFTGTVTTPLTTAGYVKTSVGGVLSSVAAIAEADVTNLVTDLAAKAVGTTTISTTAPLTGGGDLSANRTLSLTYGSGLANSTGTLIVDSAVVPLLASANVFTAGQQITNGNAATKGLLIKAAAAQSAPIFEIQDSASTVLARITTNGTFQGPVQTLSAFIRLQQESSGGSIQLTRITATVGSPGASNGVLAFRDGTTAGTLKLVVRAGVTGPETTILDNIDQSTGTDTSRIYAPNIVKVGGTATQALMADGSVKTPQQMLAAELGFTTTATAAGTTTLTNTSTYYQLFTGATTQTVVLPATSTLSTGWAFEIDNDSTGIITVQTATPTTITTVPAGVSGRFTCISTAGDTTAAWDFGYNDFNAVTGTGATVLATSATLTTPAITGPSTVTGALMFASSVLFEYQPTPTALTATGTLTVAQLLTRIITETSATAVTATLPTGTLMDGGMPAGIAANESFDWTIVNLGSASGAVTVAAGTAHTVVGSMSVPISTSATFRSRRTAANTWVTYRL